LWREIRDWLAAAYPDAVLLPESDLRGPADIGVRTGFDADFLLVIHQAHSALFNNSGAGTLEWLTEHKHCFFDADGAGAQFSILVTVVVLSAVVPTAIAQRFFSPDVDAEREVDPSTSAPRLAENRAT